MRISYYLHQTPWASEVFSARTIKSPQRTNLLSRLNKKGVKMWIQYRRETKSNFNEIYLLLGVWFTANICTGWVVYHAVVSRQFIWKVSCNPLLYTTQINPYKSLHLSRIWSSRRLVWYKPDSVHKNISQMIRILNVNIVVRFLN